MSRDSYGATESSYLLNVRTKTHGARVLGFLCFRLNVKDARRLRRSITVAALLPIFSSLCVAQDTKQLFVKNCAICHGADAGGSDRGPALTNNRRLRTRGAGDIAKIIRDGTPGG